MAFVLSKALLLFQLSFLLHVSNIVLANKDTIYGRKNEMPKFVDNTPVAVQGYVFCKACQHIGVDTLEDATPLAGALVRLECNDKQNPLIQEAKTNKNGYFSIKTKQPLTTLQFQECKVSIVSSPRDTCNIPTDIHEGLNGALLKLSHKVVNASDNQKSGNDTDFEVFAVGPFAFEAARVETCSLGVSMADNCDPNCLLICSSGCCTCPNENCFC